MIWKTHIAVDSDDSETRVPIAGRIVANCKKMALIFEAFDRKGEPRRDSSGRAIIGGPMMACAIRVSEFYLAEMLKMSGRTLAPWWESAERQYLDFLEDGPKKRSDCYQAIRRSLRRQGFKVKQFDELLDSLLEQERIVIEKSDGKGNAEMHRLRTPNDDVADSGPENAESAVAQAAEIFGRKPALHVVGGTGATGPAAVAALVDRP